VILNLTKIFAKTLWRATHSTIVRRAIDEALLLQKRYFPKLKTIDEIANWKGDECYLFAIAVRFAMIDADGQCGLSRQLQLLVHAFIKVFDLATLPFVTKGTLTELEKAYYQFFCISRVI